MTELDYRSAGVDLDVYEQAMQRLPALMKRTVRPGVMPLAGGFAGLFRLNAQHQYRDPVLVSGTDGVGTKIRVAIDTGRYNTIGIDLVAMCVNDCLCLGATPLFFLDYIAMDRDNPTLLEQLVTGISEGCLQAGAALLGGETAIMPDLYGTGDFDLAGFCVGVAENDELIDGRQRIAAGDVVIGIPSDGFHSNGYSLIRKCVFEHAGLSVDSTVEALDTTVGELLLKPTRIYHGLMQQLFSAIGNASVRAVAHITGGGLAENLSRVMPDKTVVRISRDAWKVPAEFTWLQELGSIRQTEMDRVFNMGIGLVVVVSPAAADAALKACSTSQQPAVILGNIETAESGAPAGVILD